ncbi:UNVERIFIED_CONTAM: hypothetical protein RMT77_001853 [Armadillidium vulgare]
MKPKSANSVVVRGLLLVSIVSCAAWSYDAPHCDGKTVVVHLFEWKWVDVAAECERFLAPTGFCAVQVSPPQEHILIPENGYPWWQRYQPVSYKLESRSGNEDEFKEMVKRCNKVGVRIIVDAVINHMTMVGQSGTGSGGSIFDANDLVFPGVPYEREDFTPRDMCPSSDGEIHNYFDQIEVRNCYLNGLADLYQGKHCVRQKISQYLNRLIDLGVMGFRIDASKHMWPGDLIIIQNMVKNLSIEAGFSPGARPFFFHEVIDLGNEPIRVQEYFHLGKVTEFRYCFTIVEGMRNYSELGAVYKPELGMATPNKAFIFVDNHDTQRYHSDSGAILTYKDGREYYNAVVYTLAQDYGLPRVMSSYFFHDNHHGPPSDGANTKSVIINADGTCGNGWVCEHRWPSISRMVKFRNAAGNTYKDNWYSHEDTVAFSRGGNAFFAINKYGKINQVFQTGMPPGNYCNIITNCETNLTVNEDGRAHVTVDNFDEPFVAICRGCDELNNRMRKASMLTEF